MSSVPMIRRFRGVAVSLALASTVLLPSVVASGATALATECDYDVCMSFDPAPASTQTAGVPFDVKVKLVESNEGSPWTPPEGCYGGIVVDAYLGDAEVPTSFPGSPQPVIAGSATVAVTLATAGEYGLDVHFQVNDGICPDIQLISTNITVASPGVVVTCPANAVCSASTQSASGNARAVVTAGPGATITAAFGTLDYTACGGATPVDAGGVLSFDVVNGKLLKLLQLTIDHSIAGTTKLANFKVCWNSPTKFKTASGQWAASDVGNTYTGNLPNCLSKNPTLPCIVARSKNGAGDVSLFVIAKPGDPKGYISR